MAAPKSQKKKSSDGPKVSKASKRQFKPRNKSKEAAQPQARPFQLEDDVPDFPRGGASLLSRKDREEIDATVEAELEAEEKASKSRKKNNRPRKVNAEDDLGSLFGDGVSGKLPKYANRITFKNICPGMKLWGVISEVNEKDLVVSLPGGLRGLVRAADALDPVLDDNIEEKENVLPSLFSVGQLVSSVVLQVDGDNKEKGRRRIWLSPRLSLLHKDFSLEAIQEGMVLSARVKSIEDHGYILHFGLPSFTGFLPKASQGAGDLVLQIGKLLQGVVKSIDRTRKVVYFLPDLDAVSKSVTKDLKGISMDLLVPGMLVNARVRSTLENGIMLSFLTYFTGTVDLFHLQNMAPKKDWRDEYPQHKKVNARILFIDPISRAIGLTMNPFLVQKNVPPLLVEIGDIYENSKVVRIDRGQGVLLEIPSIPTSTNAYVSVSDLAEEQVRKLEKKYKEGSKVRARILGFKHLEGLAVGVLKATAFEDSVVTHSDVKPGMVMKAKIIAVDDFGAIVQFPGGVKALCPLPHMSEFEIVKPRKKFKVGVELLFRVLGCKSKRVTVTHKKTLVKSKLPIISSYTDVSDGLSTHGWISKIEKHGCFVRFYNGVQGFAPRHELGLQPGSDPNSMYHEGQVIKCRITSSIPSARRINLSFTMKSSRISDDVVVQLRSIVSGVVDEITPRGIFVYVNGKGYSRGRIPEEHLSDHHEHATLMKSILKPGAEFDKLLVLDIEGHNLVLSAKYSLIKSAEKLPAEVSEIHPNTVVHGFVCNLIETGCFVRFLGHLTGFSPRKKATDDRNADLSESFFVGQSVRSNILDVDNETGRITVSLKQSSCSSTDSSLIESYFQADEKIAKLQLSNSNETELEWAKGFQIGSIVEGRIQEARDFGVVVSFESHKDVFGFITQYHLDGRSVEVGSTVRAVVFDVSMRERLVDLSIKPEIVKQYDNESSNSQAKKKKRKREAFKSLEVHQSVNAVVEIAKENYLVLSVPECTFGIGFAMVYDYNTQKLSRRQFANGQSVSATVMALPSPCTNGRLLMLLKSVTESSETSSSKRARKKMGFNVGSLVQAEITEIKLLEMQVKFGINLRGRIHITELNQESAIENPFSQFKVGQSLTARIIAKTENKRTSQWELSIKPEKLTDSYGTDEKPRDEDFSYSVGQSISGYVYKVDREWVWITLSRDVNAQLFILDSSCEPSELQEFQNRFYVGKPFSGYVLSINKDKKLVRLVPQSFPIPSSGTLDDVTLNITEGGVVGGRISKILSGVSGVVVQLGPSVSGRVHFTELTDSFVTDPLSDYHEGQFVKCKIIEIACSTKGNVCIDLSLRSSFEGMGCHTSKDYSDNVKVSSKRLLTMEELKPNMMVQGYVKNVSSKGCFIMLSRKIDARILLSNLADSFIDDPEKEFPVGKLLMGRVLSVEPLSNRVEVTLKSSDAVNQPRTKIYDFSCVHVGEIVSGRIKRVESYGLFIIIDHTNMVGLCHISELSDDHIDEIESKYKAGETVKAKILKIDVEKQRISLGMKSSYIQDTMDIQKCSDDESKEINSNDEVKSEGFHDSPRMVVENAIGSSAVLYQMESRASVPPLEVSLEEIENLDQEHSVDPNGHSNEVNDQNDTKSKKRAIKKAKEEREREIMAAEERLLEKDIPRTADEFEKLVRSSPNSSFIWIKYMAFMLSVADIEKAREIAERALRTINIREENEKLNVWVAYFNLENEYGNPPEEAIQKVFQRALQYCDPKKIHLALLGMYERTEQYNLADDLLGKMVKKFKHSCKVWLRWVQITLKQNKEDIQPVKNRALICLPHHKHIKFITQTAILEFKCGAPERGRSLFENMLREYPKRTDLWSVYIDQEIRLGDKDLIHALFERAISLSLPLKKIKFLFKKYLTYEKSSGDEERIEYVKRKAMEYAESAQY